MRGGGAGDPRRRRRLLTPASTEADFATFPVGAIHPLTGPRAVKGARPGDLLEVEFLEIIPGRWGFSGIFPNLGFLRDVFTTPFLVHWTVADGWATSPQIPAVRIPGAPFMGISGVAPSHRQLEAWTRREAGLAARGGIVLPPNSTAAVPAAGPCATAGLRTIPPRENGGNRGEDLNLACCNAVLGMIDLLQERGFSREQAYVICGVAVDLKISSVVDVPNVAVSACLPEDILQG